MRVDMEVMHKQVAVMEEPEAQLELKESTTSAEVS